MTSDVPSSVSFLSFLESSLDFLLLLLLFFVMAFFFSADPLSLPDLGCSSSAFFLLLLLLLLLLLFFFAGAALLLVFNDGNDGEVAGAGVTLVGASASTSSLVSSAMEGFRATTGSDGGCCLGATSFKRCCSLVVETDPSC